MSTEQATVEQHEHWLEEPAEPELPRRPRRRLHRGRARGEGPELFWFVLRSGRLCLAFRLLARCGWRFRCERRQLGNERGRDRHGQWRPAGGLAWGGGRGAGGGRAR